jgi:hypothetical protein
MPLRQNFPTKSDCNGEGVFTRASREKYDVPLSRMQSESWREDFGSLRTGTPDGLKFKSRLYIFDSELIRNSIIYPI